MLNRVNEHAVLRMQQFVNDPVITDTQFIEPREITTQGFMVILSCICSHLLYPMDKPTPHRDIESF